MKRFFLHTFLVFSALSMSAQQKTVCSPDGQVKVDVSLADGRLSYSVVLGDKTMMERSALGFTTNKGDWSQGLTWKSDAEKPLHDCYELRNAKASHINYEANSLTVSVETADKFKYNVEFRVSNCDVAFRYVVPEQKGDVRSLVVTKEVSSFKLPEQSTAFISPQSDPMVGWMHTKPSYEEVYSNDAPIATRSQFGQGYVFPCLFHVGDDGWVLVSETGVDGSYVGSHLSDWNKDKGYTVAFPMESEQNGLGSATPGLSLPQALPWRTITVGKTLAPIVETTVSYDLVEERYAPSEKYKNGRYTWSWLIWQDNYTNYETQVKFIDLAAAQGYEYILVDALWDKQIGRERVAELSRYAQKKGIRLLLWYNSNGYWNDAPQGPRNGMNSAINRHREMKWMKSIGVAGIKVDFFGGDKQQQMQLYEDILADANEYGLQVIFHGCTVPRGWERMFPNFVANEAVLASENVYFTEEAAKREAYDLTTHPFCRNATAAMDWGGVMMNKFMHRDNKSRHKRYTTDLFEMASGIMNQCAVQCVALCPNNLQDVAQDKLDWLKTLPVTWDEVKYVDGYPGRYAVIARRAGDVWYIAALNGTDKPLALTLDLSWIGQKTEVTLHDDNAMNQKVKTDKKGKLKVNLLPNGGAIIESPKGQAEKGGSK